MNSTNQRTAKQNRALHQYFTMLADELNKSGLDQRKVLKETIDIPWTPEAVKEQMWKPVLKIMVNKDSTTQMTTKEIDEVFDTINKHLGEKFGLHVSFPSIDDVLLKNR